MYFGVSTHSQAIKKQTKELKIWTPMRSISVLLLQLCLRRLWSVLKRKLNPKFESPSHIKPRRALGEQKFSLIAEVR